MGDPLTLSSPAQFKALGHPLRHRVVNLLRQRPATLGELTAALGSTKGTVGYHVRILREAGLVRLAGTRQVRGGTEQRFELVSKGFRLGEEAGVGAEFLLGAALAEMLPARSGPGDHTSLRHLWLTPDEARALAERLEALDPGRHETANPGAEAYGLLLSLYRADIPRLPPEE
ncbi:ArsR family transcriptional regulator [Nonomuraea rhodomycinica]|uniref:Winged helix-turn-helix transcriptional regulator n=1 Tax=Nonomuraea rhodomycinica TaxID=1712872 RepID=A0A7Y6ISR3_9ACTN|nr:ArsR family transcriptional regulator [Nonomuraea rhodomycinica]NUW43393.1 winged helix-turn-helix transcriptional regulator [Nonomuraea rhodomycinica]